MLHDPGSALQLSCVIDNGAASACARASAASRAAWRCLAQAGDTGMPNSTHIVSSMTRMNGWLLGALFLLPGCDPRPVALGFWMEPQTYQSPRIGDPITTDEYAVIDAIARAEITKAFERFDVTLTTNQSARYRVVVAPQLKDHRMLRRSSTYAGESRAVAGFGGSGAVNFEYLANGAMVFAPEYASRSMVIEALGRGIGRVAIHEFLHQLLPKAAIHDSKDTHSYEGNSPALVEGYYGELHWDIAGPWLEHRLKPR